MNRDSSPFKRDDNFVCDCANKHTSNNCIDTPEIYNRLAKNYIEYSDCGHKICFHCIEKHSLGHMIQPREMKCLACKEEKKENILESDIDSLLSKPHSSTFFNPMFSTATNYNNDISYQFIDSNGYKLDINPLSIQTNNIDRISKGLFGFPYR